MLWLHSKHSSVLADTLFNMKQTNGCCTSHTFSIVLFPPVCSWFSSPVRLWMFLPVCLFSFCWRCWLLQYVGFLLHLSQDHKCVLAAWSLRVTCIHLVTHSAWILSQLIVFVPASACIYADSLQCASADVIVLAYVIFFGTSVCVWVPTSVCVHVCEMPEWKCVSVVYRL